MIGIVHYFDQNDKDRACLEISKVGALVAGKEAVLGKQYTVNGMPFVILERISREQFMELVVQAGLTRTFEGLTDDVFYYRVSTD